MNTSEQLRCAECDSELARGTPKGLCPNCALRDAFASDVDTKPAAGLVLGEGTGEPVGQAQSEQARIVALGIILDRACYSASPVPALDARRGKASTIDHGRPRTSGT